MITRNTANKILEGFFGRQGNFSLASTCYIGLSTTTPDAAGSNFSEPSSSSGYARVMLGTMYYKSIAGISSMQYSFRNNREF